jgi:Ca-activated chloride channel family protein
MSIELNEENGGKVLVVHVSGKLVKADYELFLPEVERLVKQYGKLSMSKISPEAFLSKEMLTVKLRYKDPDGLVSKLVERPLVDAAVALDKTSDDFRFSAAVAAFSMVLRDSEFKGKADLAQALDLAKGGRGKDAFGYRAEFINLVEIASLIRDLKK